MRKRCEIDASMKWDLTPIYPDSTAMEADLADCAAMAEKIAACAGTLSTKEGLAAALGLTFGAMEKLERASCYAYLNYSLDGGNTAAQEMMAKTQNAGVTLMTAMSFLEPEMLTIPEEELKAWLDTPELATYRHYVLDVIRAKAHTLDAKGEAILSQVAKITGIASDTSDLFTDVELEIPKIEKLVTRIVERMRRGGRLFYIGAGTSGRLGVLDASEIPPTYGMPNTLVIGLIAGGDRALRNPVESAEDDLDKAWEELQQYHINTNDTLVGIAASGTTPYVIGALRKARSGGILTASISCNPDSPMAAEAEIAIEPIVGPEFVTGSTRMKSGTAQKMVLNMITTSTMIKLGRVKGNRMVNMQLTNQKLVDRGTRMIMEELRLDYEQSKNLLLLHGSVREAIDSYHREWRLNQ